MTIEELRRLRAGVNEKVNILAQKEIAGGQLAAEELTQFTVLEAEFAQLSTQIARMESAETMAGLVAQPVNASQHDLGGDYQAGG